MTRGDAANAEREFSRRAQMYYRLRATHRIVGASARSSRFLPDPSRLDVPRDQMRELSARLRDGDVPPDWSDRVEAIDAALGVHARELRAGLLAVELSNLRATIPALCLTDRPDVLGLLDLCIEDRAAIPELMMLIEYLITTLATSERNGRRVITEDPARLTKRVSALTTEAAGEDCNDIHAFCSEAIVQMQSWDEVDPVIKRMRAYKQTILDRFWVPTVLRALVEYNVAAGNRMQEMISAERVLDEEECDDEFLEFVRDDEGAVPEAAPTLERKPAPRPSLAVPTANTATVPQTQQLIPSEPLAALGFALRARLLERQIASGPPSAVAALLDVSRLGDFEREVLTCDDDEERSRVTREAVLLGLLLRHRAEVEPIVAEFGLRFDQIANERAPQAKKALRALISADISQRRHAESRPLAELLSRYLHDVEDLPGRTSRVASTPAVAKPAPRPAASARQRSSRSRRWSARQLRLLGVSLAFVALALFTLRVGRDDPLLPLRGQALGQISPYLESARRDGLGAGPVLTGTLDPRWASLGMEARERHATEIAGALRAAAVHEALLLDADGRLELHYSDGELRYVREPR